jgi:hypothetical protein
MKTPRITDFDPDAKPRSLKSSLENMPGIEKPKVTPGSNQSAPVASGENAVRFPEPRPVRGPVPRGVPLLPKVKRPIRQRQPFDIYEDQYQTLKRISEAEREFINGRSMSQMVRQAIDDYLKNHGSSEE